MKRNGNNRYVKKGRGGGSYAALAILAAILLAVGGYFLFGRTPDKPVKQPVAEKSIPPVAAVPKPVPPPVEIPAAKLPAQTVPVQKDTEYVQEPVMPSVSGKSGAVRASSGTARLAIIIDDMGNSMSEAKCLADIGVPLTFSIIPGLRNYREVGAYAASRGIETMIHIPMQPKEWPRRKLEENGLLVSMTASELNVRVHDYLKSIPGAAGANNHMGSEFTEHPDKMGPVLAVLKSRGLYFVDSVTSPVTVGYRMARESGVKSARRNVFLDNEQNGPYIQGQLEQAVRLAKKNGEAIAICHPHPATIKTLAATLPALKARGVTLVQASAIVR